MDDRLYTLFCDNEDDFRLKKTADKLSLIHIYEHTRQAEIS